MGWSVTVGPNGSWPPYPADTEAWNGASSSPALPSPTGPSAPKPPPMEGAPSGPFTLPAQPPATPDATGPPLRTTGAERRPGAARHTGRSQTVDSGGSTSSALRGWPSHSTASDFTGWELAIPPPP